MTAGIESSQEISGSRSRSPKQVALLDYGAGNIRSAQRALEKVGANVTVTSDPKVAVEADGLLVPGVGAFDACMKGLRAVQGPRVIGQRLAGGRPVLGICVGMQVMFDEGLEHGIISEGCAQWPGAVEKLQADVVPHMGWNTVSLAPGIEGERSESSLAGTSIGQEPKMFAGLSPDARFYFVHSYGVRDWQLETEITTPPAVYWTEYGGDKFVAAVENGVLWATQFHPEKSGEAGLHLLENWVGTL